MELFTAIIIVFALFVGIKLLILLVKTGVFVVLLPLKIFGVALLGLILLVLLPIAIIPAFFAILLPLLPFIGLGFGVILLLRHI